MYLLSPTGHTTVPLSWALFFFNFSNSPLYNSYATNENKHSSPPPSPSSPPFSPYAVLAPFSALTLFLFHHSREEIASLANISVNFSKNFKKQKSSPTWQSVKHSVVVCLFSRRSQTPQQHRDVAPDAHLMPVISLKLKTYYKRLLWEYLL